MKTTLRYLFIVNLVATLSACAPGLGVKLQLDHVSGVGPSGSETWRGIRLCLLEVQDQRPSKTLAFIEKRPLEPTGDAALIVQRALEDSLRAEGALLRCDNETVHIQLIIRRWLADVQPGFPSSELFAAATLEVEVVRQRAVLYRATYQGTSSVEHPFPSEGHIKRTLEESLQEALRALRADDALLRAFR